MRDVVIVSAVRTAIGRMGGSLKDTPVEDMGALVISEAVKRAGIDPATIDDVILGWSRQHTGASNVARVAALKADIPVEVPAYTVHRQCGSGLQAINNAFYAILTGNADIIVAGGVESVSRAPYYLKMARYGYQMGDGVLVDSVTEAGPGSQPQDRYGRLTMGLTAEIVAERFNISRTEMDEFGLLSQERAARAIAEGVFKDQIIPVPIKTKEGIKYFDTDEHPRKTSMEKLAALPPAFKEGGQVTAGNSSGFNDGASALVVMSSDKARELGLKPMARIVAEAVVGVPPEIMGIGPVPATRKVLKKTGLKLEDIDLIELNEAFASQTIYCIRELGIDINKLNVNGGAIAMGHPIGATGAILMTKLLYEMERRDSHYGLVTMCIGGGQGIATIVERV